MSWDGGMLEKYYQLGSPRSLIGATSERSGRHTTSICVLSSSSRAANKSSSCIFSTPSRGFPNRIAAQKQVSTTLLLPSAYLCNGLPQRSRIANRRAQAQVSQVFHVAATIPDLLQRDFGNVVSRTYDVVPVVPISGLETLTVDVEETGPGCS